MTDNVNLNQGEIVRQMALMSNMARMLHLTSRKMPIDVQMVCGELLSFGPCHYELELLNACNGYLLEFGTLWFEVDSSMENPNALLMWRTQFKDFANRPTF